MTSELSKTICTCTIWLATAVILTFGLFRMNGDIIFFVVATGMVAAAAVGGTFIVWQPPTESESADEAQPSAAAKRPAD